MKENNELNENNNEEFFTGQIKSFIHGEGFGKGYIEGPAGRISFSLKQVLDDKLENNLYFDKFDKSTIVKYKKGVTSKGQIVADAISIAGENNKINPYYKALEPYINSDNVYFDKAWEYEYGSKNLEEAIKYYKLAIQSGQKVPNAVKRIAEIYKKQDKKKDALKILNEYKNYMTEAKYLNTKFSILIKNPEEIYLDELTKTFNDLLKVTNDNITLQHQYANAMAIFDNYDEAIKIHQDIINKQNADVAQKKISMQALCQIEQKRNNIEEAKKWAEEILKIIPNDPFAQNILKGKEETDPWISIINETAENIFKPGKLADNIDLLKTYSEVNSEILNTYIQFFTKIKKYLSTSTFDERKGVLKEVLDELKILQTKIPANKIELYNASLQNLNENFAKEVPDFFRGTKPELNVSLDADTVSIKGQDIQFVLNITNSNKQMADNVDISLAKKGFEILSEDSLGKFYIAGCSTISKLITIRIIDESILKKDIFSIKLNVHFEYSLDFNNTDDEDFEKEINLPLEKHDFEPIENKYAAYKGGAIVSEDSMFFGRDDDINQIINDIYSGNKTIRTGRTLALYGQMRTGKSSLVNHLENALRKKDAEKNIIIHYGDISGNAMDLYSFCSLLLFRLQTELEENHSDLYSELMNGGIMTEDSLPQEHFLLQFNKIFERFCKYIFEKHSGYNIILTIDEFTCIYDYIRAGKLSDDFMMFWKAFIQNNAIYAIIICQDHMMKFVNDARFTNVFGSIELRKVTYLNEKYAKELMEKPILYHGKSRYKEGALNRLYELTSGSAYLIMKLCSELVDFINNEIHNPFITVAYIEECLKKKLPTFEEYIYFHPLFIDKSDSKNENEIAEENKRILKKIAQQSSRNEWADYKKVVTSAEDEELIKNLEERDVVIVEEKQRCKIKITLYKEWLLRKYGDF